MKLVTKVLVMNYFHTMMKHSSKVLNLASSACIMDEGMAKGIRELENVNFSLSSLLITLQLSWRS